jgi:hypothetical protein
MAGYFEETHNVAVSSCAYHAGNTPKPSGYFEDLDICSGLISLGLFYSQARAIFNTCMIGLTPPRAILQTLARVRGCRPHTTRLNNQELLMSLWSPSLGLFWMTGLLRVCEPLRFDFKPLKWGGRPIGAGA